MRPTTEYKNFEDLLKRVITVPYSVVKAKMEAEKQERAEKRKLKTSASGRASKSSP